jgi:hypothetical protein
MHQAGTLHDPWRRLNENGIALAFWRWRFHNYNLLAYHTYMRKPELYNRGNNQRHERQDLTSLVLGRV